VPGDPPALGRSDLAVERIDGPVDLDQAAILDGLAIISDPVVAGVGFEPTTFRL